jgi:hypothetical protein
MNQLLFSDLNTMDNKIEKALSIRQPYAWLICKGFKDIENRSWPTKFRGRIYVHAGVSKVYLKNSVNDNKTRLSPGQIDEYSAVMNTLAYGAIIGEVSIIDCITESSSPWFTGKYGFLLSNPVLYDHAIPCKGKLNFSKPDI